MVDPIQSIDALFPPSLDSEQFLRAWHRLLQPHLTGVGPEVGAPCSTVLLALTLWDSGHHLSQYDVCRPKEVEAGLYERELAAVLRFVADDLDRKAGAALDGRERRSGPTLPQ